MPPRKMTADHKRKLAEGRADGRVVKVYLDAIEQNRPRRRRHRPRELGAHRDFAFMRPRYAAARALAAERSARRRTTPSSEPRIGSDARSGCGIRPTTLPASLQIPAMSSRLPFGLATYRST